MIKLVTTLPHIPFYQYGAFSFVDRRVWLRKNRLEYISFYVVRIKHHVNGWPMLFHELALCTIWIQLILCAICPPRHNSSIEMCIFYLTHVKHLPRLLCTHIRKNMQHMQKRQKQSESNLEKRTESAWKFQL